MEPEYARPQKLSEKAGLLEDYTYAFLTDHNSVIYSSIYDKTEKPWTSNDIKPTDDFLEVEGFETWDLLNYENSGMATGAYLASQVFRYKVKNDKGAMKRARGAFEGIYHIYNIGCQKEEGYFPKPYGGRLSKEASTDQYLYVMKAMMIYLSIAAEDHSSKIQVMIPKMTDFWMKRNYCRSYFGIKDMSWPLGRFPVFLIMAYKVSNQKKYLDEFIRLNEEKRLYLRPTESQLAPRLDDPEKLSNYEKEQGKGFLLGSLDECAAMDIMALDECLQHSDAYKQYWLKSMKQMWLEGNLELTESGLGRFRFFYDSLSGKISSPEPGYTCDCNRINWDFWRWAGKIFTPRSTMLARAGVNVARWLPQENAEKVTRSILNKIEISQMCQYIDPDGKQILDKHHFMCHQICSDAIVNWLWAYWQGCFDGLISEKE